MQHWDLAGKKTTGPRAPEAELADECMDNPRADYLLSTFCDAFVFQRSPREGDGPQVTIHGGKPDALVCHVASSMASATLDEP